MLRDINLFLLQTDPFILFLKTLPAPFLQLIYLQALFSHDLDLEDISPFPSKTAVKDDKLGSSPLYF